MASTLDSKTASMTLADDSNEANWDDDDFAEPVMPNVDEEAFRHRSEQGGASFDEPDEDPLATFPALIVDLAPLLAVHDVDVGDGAARRSVRRPDHPSE